MGSEREKRGRKEGSEVRTPGWRFLTEGCSMTIAIHSSLSADRLDTTWPKSVALLPASRALNCRSTCKAAMNIFQAKKSPPPAPPSPFGAPLINPMGSRRPAA